VAVYNGPDSGYDQANSLAVSPDGTKVFVTGTVEGGANGKDYGTVAHDVATGETLWASLYDGPANDLDVALAVAVSPDGSKVYVTGYSSGGVTASDYATIAYDALTGSTIWVERYNGGDDGDMAFSVAVSPDGTKVFVTGESYGDSTGNDYATIAYDAATGASIWTQRYNGPGNGTDDAFSLVMSPSGAMVFVTGTSWATSTGFDYATIAYDAVNGAPRWVRRYTGAGNGSDFGQAIAVRPDGTTVFVTGYSSGGVTVDDYATMAYDVATGRAIWVRRYNGPKNSYDDAYSLAVSPDGAKVFVTGRSKGRSTLYDYATIAYDASTGVRDWLQRYDGPVGSSDIAEAVGTSSDGTAVYVTGSSWGGPMATDYATVAYDPATGSTLWVSRLNGIGNDYDQASSLATTPDGTAVLVTGLSEGPADNTDFLTVAYATS
jgi:WD40 repeat protein